MDHVFGLISKKLSPYPGSSRVSLMLPSRSFIVLCFTFRPMIHLGLVFVKGERSMSRFLFPFFFFFACGCSVVQAPFVEKTTFTPLNCLCCFVSDR